MCRGLSGSRAARRRPRRALHRAKLAIATLYAGHLLLGENCVAKERVGLAGPGDRSTVASLKPTCLLRRLARAPPLRLPGLLQHRLQELARIAPRRFRDVFR